MGAGDRLGPVALAGGAHRRLSAGHASATGRGEPVASVSVAADRAPVPVTIATVVAICASVVVAAPHADAGAQLVEALVEVAPLPGRQSAATAAAEKRFTGSSFPRISTSSDLTGSNGMADPIRRTTFLKIRNISNK